MNEAPPPMLYPCSLYTSMTTQQNIPLFSSYVPSVCASITIWKFKQTVTASVHYNQPPVAVFTEQISDFLQTHINHTWVSNWSSKGYIWLSSVTPTSPDKLYQSTVTEHFSVNCKLFHNTSASSLNRHKPSPTGLFHLRFFCPNPSHPALTAMGNPCCKVKKVLREWSGWLHFSFHTSEQRHESDTRLWC